MAAPWTTDAVLAMAPDSASASAGQGLAAPKKWSGCGRSPRAVWGLCQGSGKNPYQIRVDLAGPAFKCSCPSRKFPCKHALGLLLMLAKGAKFDEGPEPGWVSEWIDSRTERAEKKEAKAAAPPKPVDEEARVKRAAQREARVQDGVAECRVWLDDLARRGLAAVQREPGSFWENAAARMVDAQAPGLAHMIRRIAGATASGEGWHRRTLDLMGRLHLLLAAADRLDQLPPDLAADVRVALGKTQAREEALATPGVTDRWSVVGQITEEQDRLRVRRTWLAGAATGRRALLLDFAAGAQPMEPAPALGSAFKGELAFYPSRLGLRALVKTREADAAPDLGAAPDRDIEAGLAHFAQALALDPWLPRWPLILPAVVPVPAGDRWSVVDQSGMALPVRPAFAGAWRMLSVGGGQPVLVCGEWDGEFLLPLSVRASVAQAEDIAPRWAA